MLNTFSRLDDVDLQVIGDGDLLKTLRGDYAHCKNIDFLGKRKQAELVGLYQNASALVLPSLAPETFGLAVAEAFSCATPAIIRDAGGSRDLVDATGAGFVYRSEDELEQSVKEIAADNVLRANLGKKARKGFCDRYTATHHLDAYLDLITDIRDKKAVATR
jgi:glycosyltransferase involved in cell wall biosynthesis